MRLAALAVALPLAAFSASLAPPRGAPSCPPGSTTVVEVVRDATAPAYAYGEQVLSVPRFRPGPGRTLLAVEVRAVVTVAGGLRLENKDPLNPCLASLRLGVRAEFFQPELWDQLTEVQALFEGTALLEAHDGQVDFLGPSGTSVRVPRRAATGIARIDDPALLAAHFEGPGRYALRMLLQDRSGYAGCAPCSFLADPTFQLELEVRYTVCVAP
jgi:hypothetical protein